MLKEFAPTDPDKKAPVLGVFAHLLDAYVGNAGLLTRISELTSRLHMVDLVYLDEKTRRALADLPVLLAANHPGEFDALALLVGMAHDNGIRNRKGEKDFSIVAVDDLAIFGPKINSHLIPVSLSDKREAVQHSKGGAWRRHLDARIPQDSRKNVRAMYEATRRLNAGGLVTILPSGADRTGNVWSPGVGKIIQSVTHPDAVLVMANIQGTGNDDPKKIITGRYNATITFGMARSIAQIQRESEGKKASQIAEELRQMHQAEFSSATT